MAFSVLFGAVALALAASLAFALALATAFGLAGSAGGQAGKVGFLRISATLHAQTGAGSDGNISSSLSILLHDSTF